MIEPNRACRLRYVSVDILPLRSLLLALFLVSGVLCGYLLSNRCGAETANELRESLDAYAEKTGGLTGSAALQTLICFFRAPVLAFLLGFASLGVVALPALLAAQGFVISFSMFSFAAVLGRDGFRLLPALFAIRLLFVLPCTLVLAAAALEKSRALAALSFGGGRRLRPVFYGSPYWYRFAVCCVCLLIGCALELWLSPLLLTR